MGLREAEAFPTRTILNTGRCQGVVAADAAPFIGDDKGSACTACMIGKRPALELFIEHGLAALEVIRLKAQSTVSLGSPILCSARLRMRSRPAFPVF